MQISLCYVGGSSFGGGDYVSFGTGRHFSNGFRIYASGGGRRRFDFGMHRERHIDDIDVGYLQWIDNKFSELDPWWKAAASALTRRKMDQELSDVRALLSDLKSCTKTKDIRKGRGLHKNAVEAGIDSNIYVANTLINLYAKCGSIEDAKTVFDNIQEPSVASWNSLILGYTDNGQALVALDLFSRMKDDGKCAPKSLTYLAALKACMSLAADGGEAECLQRGRQIHSEIGRHMDHLLQSRLINLYAKCGSMEDARIVFDSIQDPDMVTWTALILGYVDNGQAKGALDFFSRMKNEGTCAPDSFTYVAALKACTLLVEEEGEPGKRVCLEMGRQIHSEIGCHMDHFVQSMLIKLYAKCGCMESVRTVFDSIVDPDVASWTALILGYAENGQALVALDLFYRMMDECRGPPDSLTYVAALMACSSIGALAIGRRIHSMISVFDPHVITCLVDFYAKCGSMDEAREVFDLHPQVRDASTWTALLAGYAHFGDTAFVFSLFEAMQDQGFQPDAFTFVCVLSCCSHAGLVEKAWEYLEVMPTRFGITPTVMHYSCMIDLLGRANKLDEAVALLQKMSCDPDAVIWMTLLGACRKWKNVEIGKWAFKSLMNLDQKQATAYVLMAEIYGSRGMWEDQERVWLLEARMKFSACKLPGTDPVMDTVDEDDDDDDAADVKNGLQQGLQAMKRPELPREHPTRITRIIVVILQLLMVLRICWTLQMLFDKPPARPQKLLGEHGQL